MLRSLLPGSSHRSLISLSAYRDAELRAARCSTNDEGDLLEHATLELRVHPPNVELRAAPDGAKTILTIDSANRPGTLVEVVQCLTEMGLNVSRARISSDGGWFVDEFEVDRVSDPAKEAEITRVLTVEPYQGYIPQHTVFELSGPDRAGLLAEVVGLLKHNGCEVDHLAVWTSGERVACVVSVTQLAQGLASSPAASRMDGSISTSSSAAAGPAAAAGSAAQGRGVSSGGSPRMGSTSDMLSQSSAALRLVRGTPGGAHGPVQGQGAVTDPVKLQRLQQLLARIMDPTGKDPGVVVQVNTVLGGIHFERRLHQLLMRTDEAAWEAGADVVPYYEALVGDGQGELPTWSSPASTLASSQHSGIEAATSSWIEHALPANGASLHAHGLTGQDALRTSSNGCGAVAGAGRQAGRSVLAAPSTHWPNGSHSQASGVAVVGMGHEHNGGALGAEGPCCLLLSPKFSAPVVMIRYNKRLQYWLIDIRCKDRKKLFFDTVCTLAELQYDIFHASVDVDADTHTAHQVYYVRRSTGDSRWCQHSAAKLSFLLERAIARRFPKGVKVRIQSWQQYDLAALTAAWRDAGLLITRAKVRACPGHATPSGGSAAGAASGRGAAAHPQPATNTFYLLDQQGQAPDPAIIQQACARQGGVALDLSSVSAAPAGATAAAAAAGATGYAGSRAKAGLPPRPQGPMEALRERLPQGAAFGFALLQRHGVGSPSSMSSSM